VLSALQLGWIDPAEGRPVALVLIGFVFPAQLLAAIFSYLARDGVAATGMATLSLIWLVVGLTLYTAQPGATSAMLGVFLLFGGTAMALNGLTAAMSKLVPAAVFLTASLRFLLAAGQHLSGGGAGWRVTSGVLGLLLFALAIYAAWAAELEEAAGRTVLPLGRRGKGKVAVHGSLLEQLKEISTRPGVRQQL
jgi:uncharacterized protein